MIGEKSVGAMAKRALAATGKRALAADCAFHEPSPHWRENGPTHHLDFRLREGFLSASLCITQRTLENCSFPRFVVKLYRRHSQGHVHLGRSSLHLYLQRLQSRSRLGRCGSGARPRQTERML